jgi:hypothetical protein
MTAVHDPDTTPALSPSEGPQPSTTPTTATTPRRSPYRRLVVFGVSLGSLVLAVLAVVVALRLADSEPTSEPTQHVYVIDWGTARQIELGQHYFLVPGVLRVTEGDELVVENNDERPHVIGPITVRPGERISYTFTSAGYLQGACTVHPEDEMVIIVEPRT